MRGGVGYRGLVRPRKDASAGSVSEVAAAAEGGREEAGWRSAHWGDGGPAGSRSESTGERLVRKGELLGGRRVQEDGGGMTIGSAEDAAIKS